MFVRASSAACVEAPGHSQQLDRSCGCFRNHMIASCRHTSPDVLPPLLSLLPLFAALTMRQHYIVEYTAEFMDAANGTGAQNACCGCLLHELNQLQG